MTDPTHDLLRHDTLLLVPGVTLTPTARWTGTPSWCGTVSSMTSAPSNDSCAPTRR